MKIGNQLFWYLAIALVVQACSSGGNDDRETPPVETKNPPAKVVGTLPENGEPCSDYETVSGNDTKVLVQFKWNSAQFAQSYELTVRDNDSEVFNASFSALETKVELDRGKTYTWNLMSINDDGSTNGDTYSFTTPGVQVGNYAPYAAEIEVEFVEADTEMTISWIGSDEDGDSLTYDVFVLIDDETISETLETETTQLAPIVYISGTVYSIRVISKDGNGNSSISELQVQAP
ncbi:hypothetical protein [Flagellimonas myxillae]|uniref:hypothetical protein n=1 Tax=Flagellimonas myxillae TaxID=2942214 RepID=UPI00201EDE61|nr:hypothetical protein [Muricauda myxillae]MCL6267060.1 hypothetical protein [Muricauda myxillae]